MRSARKRPAAPAPTDPGWSAATSFGRRRPRHCCHPERVTCPRSSTSRELPLQIEIQVGDLVEEQRAAVRLLEHARVILDGASVCAPRRAPNRCAGSSVAGIGATDR